jgi:asparagine N-glycosylation enzyme membrane subunit Stt3
VPRQPLPEWPLIHYVDAYPPLFDFVLSFASAWGGAVNAPIKAVSAVAAALAVPAFYFLVLRLLRRPRVAAVASALYAVLPGNLTGAG